MYIYIYISILQTVGYMCKIAELTRHGVDLKAMQREKKMRQTKDK